jgi:hypothetical protein
MTATFSWQGIAAKQVMYGSVHYNDAETTVSVIGHATSSEMHHASSAKLACRNDQ